MENECHFSSVFFVPIKRPGEDNVLQFGIAFSPPPNVCFRNRPASGIPHPLQFPARPSGAGQEGEHTEILGRESGTRRRGHGAPPGAPSIVQRIARGFSSRGKKKWLATSYLLSWGGGVLLALRVQTAHRSK